MGTTKQSFVYIAPPSMPILPGATTPESKPGATTWSTIANSMLVWTGTSWQYPVPIAAPATKTVSIVSVSSGRLITATDAFKYLRSTSASDIQLTIPTDAVTNFDIGTYIEGCQAGMGGIAFVPAPGVTLNAAASFQIADYVCTRTQFSGFNLVKVAANEWDITGDVLGTT